MWFSHIRIAAWCLIQCSDAFIIPQHISIPKPLRKFPVHTYHVEIRKGKWTLIVVLLGTLECGLFGYLIRWYTSQLGLP